MANKSSIETNNIRRRLVDNKKATRESLKEKLRSKELSFDERMATVHKLAEMPRNSSKVRIRNRCNITGRPRSYYRKFGISRIALRELASQGYLPGVVKLSW